MRVALCALVALTVTGCDLGPADPQAEEFTPRFKTYTVTGTDGQAATASRPAEIAPLQGGGLFTVAYDTRLPPSPDRSGEVKGLSFDVLVSPTDADDPAAENLYSTCCSGEGCETGRFRCVYDNASGVTCSHPTPTLRSDLAAYFAKRGGLPNRSNVIVQICNGRCGLDNLFRRQYCAEQGEPVVFR